MDANRYASRSQASRAAGDDCMKRDVDRRYIRGYGTRSEPLAWGIHGAAVQQLGRRMGRSVS